MRTWIVVGVLLASTVSGRAADCAANPLAQECLAAKSHSRIGKYFCYVEHAVGIQYPKKPQGGPDLSVSPFVGKITFPSDKFTMEISQHPGYEMCKNGSSQSPLCPDTSIKRYVIEAKGTNLLSLGRGDDTFDFDTFMGIFKLRENLVFNTAMMGGSSYLADGKCERIN